MLTAILVLLCSLQAISSVPNKWLKTAGGKQAFIPYVIDTSAASNYCKY